MQVGHLSFAPFVPSSIGFDRFFENFERLSDTTSQVSKFPPHNIIRTDDYHFTIEMAVAGFSEKDIDVTLKDGVLSVEGEKKLLTEDKVSYVHQGIANRSFVKTFQLADSVEVRSAKLQNGLLRIDLEVIVPESRKARKIPLVTESQLLTE